MKFSVALLFFIFLSLSTLTLSAQSSSTEVVSKKSRVVSKKSRDKKCIPVSQNLNNLPLGQEVVITVQSCQSLEIHKVFINGTSIVINDKGVAKLNMPSGPIGTHNIPVDVVFRDKNGNRNTKSYTVTYKVNPAPSQ